MVLKFKTIILETGETIEAGLDETITFIEAHVANTSDAGLDHLASLMADCEDYDNNLEDNQDLLSAIRTAGERLHVDIRPVLP